ncbi:MAG TPA: ABC transporter substrate-binding protein [Paenibacillus sp.]|jgi:iron complex transport system substrate-binding protein
MKKLTKLWISGLLALVMALSLAGCGADNKVNKDAQNASVVEQPATTEEQPAATEELKTVYPLTVKDSTGESFTFAEAPKRIVSVSPAETEALFAIGLDNEIVGVSDYDDYPEAVVSKPKMGGVMKPNEEAIIASEADIVFTGISMSEEAVKKLRDLGIQIFKTDPKTVEDILSNIELYGQITDHQAQAKVVMDHMKQERDEVIEAVKSVTPEQKKKVYVEFSPGWTVGKGEFMDELITLAGGVNVASDTVGWNKISEEKIIQDNPDVILYSKNVIDDVTKKGLDDMIKGRSGWDQITAVKNEAIFGLDDNLLSRPGPRATAGLKEVAKAIYPDLFK